MLHVKSVLKSVTLFKNKNPQDADLTGKDRVSVSPPVPNDTFGRERERALSLLFPQDSLLHSHFHFSLCPQKPWRRWSLTHTISDLNIFSLFLSTICYSTDYVILQEKSEMKFRLTNPVNSNVYLC